MFSSRSVQIAAVFFLDVFGKALPNLCRSFYNETKAEMFFSVFAVALLAEGVDRNLIGTPPSTSFTNRPPHGEHRANPLSIRLHASSFLQAGHRFGGQQLFPYKPAAGPRSAIPPLVGQVISASTSAVKGSRITPSFWPYSTICPGSTRRRKMPPAGVSTLPSRSPARRRKDTRCGSDNAAGRPG